MLDEIQKYMKEYIINDNIEEDLLQLISDDLANKEELLKIYKNNVFGNLTESLKNTYPLLECLLGSESFKKIARKYIKANLPKEGALILWGKNFPAFVDQLDDLKNYPYLPDVALFDLLWHESYHSEEDQALKNKHLQAIIDSNQEFKLKLRNSVRFIESKYPIDLIWQSYVKSKKLEDPVDMTSRGAKILIWRKEFQVHIQLVTEYEYIFISQLDSKTSLEKVLKSLHQKNNFSEAEISKLFTKFLNLQIFKKPARMSAKKSY